MMSGTTTVVAMMYRNVVICANSGDSRAVMFSLINSGSVGGSQSVYWKAVALSRDHKPDEPDEAARIKACNGRVE